MFERKQYDFCFFLLFYLKKKLILTPTEDYIGYGNSFHAKGGRGTKRAQLKYCLRVVRSIVSTNTNEQAIQDLTDQGALSILSNIIKKYSFENNPNDQIDVEIQSDVLFVLTCICENDLHRKVKKNKKEIRKIKLFFI